MLTRRRLFTLNDYPTRDPNTLVLFHFNKRSAFPRNCGTNSYNNGTMVWSSGNGGISVTDYERGLFGYSSKTGGYAYVKLAYNYLDIFKPFLNTTNTWTIEGFIRGVEASSKLWLFSVGTVNSVNFSFFVNTNGHMQFGTAYIDTTYQIDGDMGYFVGLDFHHFAVVRTNSVYTLYADGNLITRQTHTSLISAPNPAGSLTYGTTLSSATNFVEEFRVSNVARYTGSTYVVPTKQFN